MDEFIQAQFFHHQEVSPHITLYLFDHRDPIYKLQAVRQKVEAQKMFVAQLKNMFKEIYFGWILLHRILAGYEISSVLMGGGGYLVNVQYYVY